MDAIQELVNREKPQQAAIIGGGYIGLEMAEALRQRQVGVTLIEVANQVMVAADPEMVTSLNQELKLHGVDLRLGTSVKSFVEEGNLLYIQLNTGESLPCGLAILATGVRPDVRLAQEAGLAIGQTGGILVDEHPTARPSVSGRITTSGA